jgi:hypothetical protein
LLYTYIIQELVSVLLGVFGFIGGALIFQKKTVEQSSDFKYETVAKKRHYKQYFSNQVSTSAEHVQTQDRITKYIKIETHVPNLNPRSVQSD